MKKLLILVLALMLALSLAACGGKTEQAGANATGQKTEGFVSLNAKSAVTLKSLKLDKTKYQKGDTITVTVTAEGVDDECNAWVGIVPADVAHGDEDECDKYDLDYYYLNSLENGKAEFAIELEAGKYDIRVLDSDDNGVELGYISFEYAD